MFGAYPIGMTNTLTGRGNDMTLRDTYKRAALIALHDNVRASNEPMLTAWIRQNCSFRLSTEFFLVLGIGAELADLEANCHGYKSEVDRAFDIAATKTGYYQKLKVSPYYGLNW